MDVPIDSVDQGPSVGKKRIPERRCLVSGVRMPTDLLVRCVVAPDSTLVFDLDQTLPGRGMWIHPTPDNVHAAVKRRAFQRAARQQVVLPDDLIASLQSRLTHRMVDAVGLARRSGQLVFGFEKVRDALRHMRQSAHAAPLQGYLLLQATDASADSAGKIAALAPGLETISDLERAQLGQIFARDNAVFVLIQPGGLARKIKKMAQLLRVLGDQQSGKD
jgi:predicted RNA-binding protein YlxR (DUF448 family)